MRWTLGKTVTTLASVVATTGLLAAVALPASASAAPSPRVGSSHSSHSSTSSHRDLGYTQVTVAPSTLAALTSLGVAPGVVAPGKVVSGSPLSVRFPITGYCIFGLSIRHSGGITLTAGATTVTITDLNIDLGRLRVSGVVAGIGRVDLFKIKTSDDYRLGLVKLTLTATAAGALDAAFGTTALTENFLFGYATPRPFAHL